MSHNLIVENADLKNQCYRRKFYGKTDEIENELALLEGESSILLKNIIETEKLPLKGSSDYSLLLTFIMIQLLRTKRRADLLNETVDSDWKAVMEEDTERYSKEDLDRIKIGMNDPIIVSLSMATPEFISLLDDLEPHLLIVGKHRHFITSDNPVVEYNQYYEWLKDLSNIGLVSRGLQIFLPLSPQCLLILYDKGIYSTPNNCSITNEITNKDSDAINSLQFINADQNIFFDSIQQKDEILRISGQAERLRLDRGVKNQKYDSFKDGRPNKSSTLIVSYYKTPNIHMSLSFLKVKRTSKKIPWRQRLKTEYRREFPDIFSSFDPPPRMPEWYIRRKKNIQSTK